MIAPQNPSEYPFCFIEIFIIIFFLSDKTKFKLLVIKKTWERERKKMVTRDSKLKKKVINKIVARAGDGRGGLSRTL